MKPPDWVLPDPDNESLTLAWTVLLRHLDSFKTIPFCSGTGAHLTLIIIILSRIIIDKHDQTNTERLKCKGWTEILMGGLLALNRTFVMTMSI